MHAIVNIIKNTQPTLLKDIIKLVYASNMKIKAFLPHVFVYVLCIFPLDHAKSLALNDRLIFQMSMRIIRIMGMILI